MNLKEDNNNEIDDTNFFKRYKIIKNAISIISVGIICIILITTFLNLSNFTSKIIFLPILYCVLCISGYVLAKIFQQDKLKKIFLKGYTISFLIYWFGVVSFWTISAIKQEGGYQNALYSIPFWLAGFYVLYKNIIKK